MKPAKYFLIALNLTATILLLESCSVTGWSAKEPPKGLNLSEGETITIMQKDGSLLTGEYLGIGMMPFENYVKEYNLQTQESYEGTFLPAIGQNVDLLTAVSGSKVWEGQFMGFDHRSIRIKMIGELQPEEIYFSSITNLSSRDGKMFQRMALRSMFLDGKIPLMSALEIKNAKEKMLVPISSIKEISVKNASGNETGGGIVMDGNSFRETLMR